MFKTLFGFFTNIKKRSALKAIKEADEQREIDIDAAIRKSKEEFEKSQLEKMSVK